MKNTFAANVFASKTFASGAWRGVGVTVDVIVSPVDSDTQFTSERRRQVFTAAERVHGFTSQDRTQVFTAGKR